MGQLENKYQDGTGKWTKRLDENAWIDWFKKQCPGLLLSNRKEWTTDIHNSFQTGRELDSMKKLSLEGYMMNGSIYMIVLKIQL